MARSGRIGNLLAVAVAVAVAVVQPFAASELFFAEAAAEVLAAEAGLVGCLRATAVACDVVIGAIA